MSFTQKQKNSQVKQSRKEYLKEWRKRNPNKVKDHKKTQYWKNPEQNREKARIRYYKKVNSAAFQQYEEFQKKIQEKINQGFSKEDAELFIFNWDKWAQKEIRKIDQEIEEQSLKTTTKN